MHFYFIWIWVCFSLTQKVKLVSLDRDKQNESFPPAKQNNFSSSSQDLIQARCWHLPFCWAAFGMMAVGFCQKCCLTSVSAFGGSMMYHNNSQELLVFHLLVSYYDDTFYCMWRKKNKHQTVMRKIYGQKGCLNYALCIHFLHVSWFHLVRDSLSLLY